MALRVFYCLNKPHLSALNTAFSAVSLALHFNTHQSESLIKLVAAQCEIDKDLGEKGVSGIFKSMETRKVFLSNTEHRIRFVYTPTHHAP
jgi:hypothetical protein